MRTVDLVDSAQSRTLRMLEGDRDPSAQLQDELQDSIAEGFSTGKPILTHLNADTTWLLSLAYPEGFERPENRQRFNVLVDPWLTGPQSDVASWFSTQWHKIESSVKTIAELNSLLADRETAQESLSEPVNGKGRGTGDQNRDDSAECFIDAVVISHEFTDHCHRATLQEVDRGVPVFATTKAAELMRSWKHFDHVFDMAIFGKGTDWRTTSMPPLPPWLGIARLVTPGDALYYHSAIVICFDSPASGNADCVLYTPHGVEAGSFAAILSAKPPVRTLAFLHGLHDVSITLTKQLNLGAHNALKAQRILQSQYWVGTHDEIKKGGGLIAPFLRRKAHTLLDALSTEASSSGSEKGVGQEGSQDRPVYIDLASGDSLVLL